MDDIYMCFDEAVSGTGEKYIETVKKKLDFIIRSEHFCGICLKNVKDDEYYSLNTDFTIFIRGKICSKQLKDIVRHLFYDVNTIPASPYACTKCMSKILESFIFIEKTKELAETMNSYVNDLFIKAVDVDNQLDPNVIYDNNNIALVLERYDDNQDELQLLYKEIKSQMKIEKQSSIQQPDPNILQKYAKDITSTKDNALDAFKEPMIRIEIETENSRKNATEDKNEPNNVSHIHTCKICLQAFNSPKALEEHYESHKKLVCWICKEIIDSREFMAHIKFNHPTYFSRNRKMHPKVKCPHCTTLRRNRTQCVHYKYLIQFRENRPYRTIKCLDCDFTTINRDIYLGHVNSEHLSYRPFTCDDCGSQFFCKSYLIRHIHSNHSMICKFCDFKEISLQKMDRHIELCAQEDREYKCDIEECVASFDTEDQLSHHIQLRHSAKNFQCSLCSDQFSTKLDLIRHKLILHKKTKNGIEKQSHMWQCFICELKMRPRDYYKHMKLHGPDIRYFCKKCDIEFADLQRLRWHNRKHLPKVNVPSVCNLCGKVYSSQSSLRGHMHWHRSQKTKNTRLWPCKICGKTFLMQNNLKLHLKVHVNRVPCKVCGKLIKPLGMARHMKLHSTVERIYIDSTKQKSSLMSRTKVSTISSILC